MGMTRMIKAREEGGVAGVKCTRAVFYGRPIRFAALELDGLTEERNVCP